MNRFTLAVLITAFFLSFVGCDSFTSREESYEPSPEAQQPEKVLLSVDNPTGNETGETIESAIVYIDGDSLGQTPVEDSVTFSQEQKNLTVLKKGYQAWSEKISLTRDVSFTPVLEPKVVIPPDNNAPVARMTAERTTVSETGEEVIFHESGSSDADGDIVEYEFRYPEGSTEFLNADFSHTVTIQNEGFRSFGLRVKDDDGEWSSWTNIIITVSQTDARPPVTRAAINGNAFADDLPAEFELVNNGSFSPDSLGIDAVQCSGAGQTKNLPATFTVNEVGLVNFNCQAVDNEGNYGSNFLLTATVDTTSDPDITRPPIARAKIDGPTTVNIGDEVTVVDDGSFSPDDVSIVSREWRTADGRTQAGESASFSFESPGVKTIYYTVTDSKGNVSATHTLVVYVTEPEATETTFVLEAEDKISDEYIEDVHVQVGDLFSTTVPVVQKNGRYVSVLDTTLSGHRGETHQLEFSADGYFTQTESVTFGERVEYIARLERKPPETVSHDYTVRDGDTGEKLPNAKITVDDASGNQLAAGQGSLRKEWPYDSGSVTVRVSKDGYISASLTFSTTENVNTPIYLTPIPESGTSLKSATTTAVFSGDVAVWKHNRRVKLYDSIKLFKYDSPMFVQVGFDADYSGDKGGQRHENFSVELINNRTGESYSTEVIVDKNSICGWTFRSADIQQNMENVNASDTFSVIIHWQGVQIDSVHFADPDRNGKMVVRYYYRE